MHIELDTPRCEGHGLCEEAAPELMHLDEEGDLIIDVPDVDENSDQGERARTAARVCPVAALKLH